MEIFEQNTYPVFQQCADSWIPGQPQEVSAALTDMAFNMGCSGLEQFTSMKSAIQAGDYQKAAQDAENSLWCGQVGARCQRDAACIASGGSGPNPTPSPTPYPTPSPTPY